MGIFSMCQFCGSDMCDGECVIDPVIVILRFLEMSDDIPASVVKAISELKDYGIHADKMTSDEWMSGN